MVAAGIKKKKQQDLCAAVFINPNLKNSQNNSQKTRTKQPTNETTENRN